jgi:hypothetical protein
MESEIFQPQAAYVPFWIFELTLCSETNGMIKKANNLQQPHTKRDVRVYSDLIACALTEEDDRVLIKGDLFLLFLFLS